MLNGYLYSAIPMMLLEYSPTLKKILKNKIMSHSSRRYARHLLVKSHISHRSCPEWLSWIWMELVCGHYFSHCRWNSPWKFICCHYAYQFMLQVDQKRYWVKLKSVQTFLRIVCITIGCHIWSLHVYVPIHVKSWPYRADVGSNIAQTRLFSRSVKGHEVN